LVYWYRKKRREEEEKDPRVSLSLSTEQRERDMIVSQVCKRFKSDNIEDDAEDKMSTKSGTWCGNFAARVRRLRGTIR
jgi:hypothetical protein